MPGSDDLNPQPSEDVVQRLKRIEGEARRIQRMVDEDRDCHDLMTQMAAMRAATQAVNVRIDSDEVGTIINVREATEFDGGSIARAVNLPYRLLEERIRRLPPREPALVVCNSGNRSAVGASLLLRSGIQAANLAGGTTAW